MNRILFMINSVLLVGLIVSNTHESTMNTNNTSVVDPAKIFKPTGPFNLGGSMPYQVWVNGERLPLNGDMAKQIVNLLDLEPFEQPTDTAEIHSGAGWLRPIPITQ